jgi:hypothetical protein
MAELLGQELIALTRRVTRPTRYGVSTGAELTASDGGDHPSRSA